MREPIQTSIIKVMMPLDSVFWAGCVGSGELIVFFDLTNFSYLRTCTWQLIAAKKTMRRTM